MAADDQNKMEKREAGNRRVARMNIRERGNEIGRGKIRKVGIET